MRTKKKMKRKLKKQLKRVYKKLLKESVPNPPEINTVIEDHFWELV